MYDISNYKNSEKFTISSHHHTLPMTESSWRFKRHTEKEPQKIKVTTPFAIPSANRAFVRALESSLICQKSI